MSRNLISEVFHEASSSKDWSEEVGSAVLDVRGRMKEIDKFKKSYF